MTKLKPREVFILVLTLALAVFFVVYQFIIKPMHEGSMDVDDQLRLDREQLIKDAQLVAQRPSVESSYKNLAGLIGSVGSEEAQIPTIISKIETAARQTNIHIANIQPQKSVTQKEATFLAVELEIDGQWLDIVQFLYLLQQSPNFYFINELNLEKYSDTVNSLRGRIVISRMCLTNL